MGKIGLEGRVVVAGEVTGPNTTLDRENNVDEDEGVVLVERSTDR